MVIILIKVQNLDILVVAFIFGPFFVILVSSLCGVRRLRLRNATLTNHENIRGLAVVSLGFTALVGRDFLVRLRNATLIKRENIRVLAVVSLGFTALAGREILVRLRLINGTHAREQPVEGRSTSIRRNNGA